MRIAVLLLFGLLCGCATAPATDPVLIRLHEVILDDYGYLRDNDAVLIRTHYEEPALYIREGNGWKSGNITDVDATIDEYTGKITVDTGVVQAIGYSLRAIPVHHSKLVIVDANRTILTGAPYRSVTVRNEDNLYLVSNLAFHAKRIAKVAGIVTSLIRLRKEF